MNEYLDLVEILKDCPVGTPLYSLIFGNVRFHHVDDKAEKYPIFVIDENNNIQTVTSKGLCLANYDGECLLFPSKTQRDWSKFKIPIEKFDPKTLMPFDRVLVRNATIDNWYCSFFSHNVESPIAYPFFMIDSTTIKYCIPYNYDTKHLLGTSDEAPEFYRYWED